MRARLIITKECHRGCRDCATSQPGVIHSARPITAVEELAEYEEIIVTGGEPMLDPVRTQRLLAAIRARFRRVPLYLYTALYHPAIGVILDMIDGLTYSLHEPAAAADIAGFDAVQNLLWGRDGSYRLWVDSAITRPIRVYPFLWSRIATGRMIPDCPLPAGEVLLIWEPPEPGSGS